MLTQTQLDRADYLGEQAYQDNCAERYYEQHLADRFDIQSIPAPQTFTHIVTLINRRTEEEACIVVTTASDRFTEVLQAIRIQRILHGLTNFEIHESIACDAPF